MCRNVILRGPTIRDKSAVGLSYKLVLYTLSLLAASVLMSASKGNLPFHNVILSYAAVIITEAFLLWIRFGSYYELREDYLYCRSGPFVEKIRYDHIKSVRLCDRSVSSMALSPKSIEIRQYCKVYLLGVTMISPVNREEFFRQLLMRCNNLQFQADAQRKGEAYVRTVLYPRG